MRKYRTLDEVLKEEMKNPEFKKAFDEEDLPSRVAIQIARLREEKSLSQKELAKRLHTTQQTISKIENADQNVTLKTIQKLASVFHKKVELKFV